MKRLLIASIAVNLLCLSYMGYKLIDNNRKKKENPYLAYKYTNYNYWKEKNSLQSLLPIDSGSIVFVGNSLTDGGEWYELLHNPRIINRGIGGDDSEGLLCRIENLVSNKPAAIFISEGFNDIAYGTSLEKYIANMEAVIRKVKAQSPATKIFVQSILPTNTFHNKSVPSWNQALKDLSRLENVTYLDNHSQFVDSKGGLKKDFTFDGVHLTGDGYILWAWLLKPYLKSFEGSALLATYRLPAKTVH